MSQKLNAAIAVIGVDIGKNSFHVVGQDHRASKIVMVHTAIEDPAYGDEPWVLWSSLVDQLS